MTKLFVIVRNLLREHSMVIVPGLGGFVANNIGARLDKVTGRFYPPSVEVVFNAKLVHNDGLLASAVAKELSLTSDEANKQIDEEVKKILAALGSTKKFVLEGLGLLERDGKNLIFHADYNSVSSVDAFGLSDFFFPELDEDEIKKRNLLVSNNTKGNSNFSITAIAVAFAFLLFAQPLHKEPSSSYQASLALDNPCEWIKNDLQVGEKESRYSVILSRFDSECDAKAYLEEHTEEAAHIDSLEISKVGEDYVVSFPSTENWNATVQILMEVNRSMPSVPYPFIFCKEENVVKN